MRKTIIISVLILYASLCVTEVVRIHFCSGIPKSVVFGSNKTSCCNTGEEHHDNCCSDIDVVIDFDPDHISQEPLRAKLPVWTVLVYDFEFASLKASDLFIFTLAFVPPEALHSPNIYQLTHSYLL